MKKILAIVLSIVMILSLLPLNLRAEGDDNEPVEVIVKGGKVRYYEGEIYNPSELQLLEQHKNGPTLLNYQEAIAKGYSLEYSFNEVLEKGTYQVNVKKNGKVVANFDINVVDVPKVATLNSINIIKEQNKKAYKAQEEFKPEGLIVRLIVRIEDKDTVIDIPYESFHLYNLTVDENVGNQENTVNIRYNGPWSNTEITAVPEYKLVEKYVTNLELKGMEKRMIENSVIPLDDLALDITYDDDTTETISSYSLYDFIVILRDKRENETAYPYRDTGKYEVDFDADPVLVGDTLYFYYLKEDAPSVQNPQLLDVVVESANQPVQSIKPGKVCDSEYSCIKQDYEENEVIGTYGIKAILVYESGATQSISYDGFEGANITMEVYNSADANWTTVDSKYKLRVEDKHFRFVYAKGDPSKERISDNVDINVKKKVIKKEVLYIVPDAENVKDVYYVGEKLDTSNLTVEIYFEEDEWNGVKVTPSEFKEKGLSIVPETFTEAGDSVSVYLQFDSRYNYKKSPSDNRAFLMTVKVKEMPKVKTLEASKVKTSFYDDEEINTDDITVTLKDQEGEVIKTATEGDNDISIEVKKDEGKIVVSYVGQNAVAEGVTPFEIPITVSERPKVMDIQLNKDSIKVYDGDEIDFSDLKAILTYHIEKNGKLTEEIPFDKFEETGISFEKISTTLMDREEGETKKITFTYNGNYKHESGKFSAVLTVNIQPKPLVKAIELVGDFKAEYYEGESVKLDGLKVKLIKSDGSEDLIDLTSKKINVKPKGNLTTDDKTVTFEYIGDDKATNGTFTIVKEIIVKEMPKVKELRIKTKPIKLEYNLNDKFDPTGMVIELVNTDEKVVTIKIDSMDYQNDMIEIVSDTSVVGESEVIVRYIGDKKAENGTFEDSFKINVTEKPVTPTPPYNPEPTQPFIPYEPTPAPYYPTKPEVKPKRPEVKEEKAKEEEVAKEEKKEEMPVVKTYDKVMVPNQNKNVVFSDISGNRYENSIINMARIGLLNGVEENLFAPNDGISRAMVVTTFMRLSSDKSFDTGINFSDASNGQWFYEAVKWANSKGIVNGFEDGTFKPMKEITRGEFAVMLYRFMQYIGFTPVEVRPYVFTDVTDDWLLNEVKAVYSQGLLDAGTEGSFDQNSRVTRGELAETFARLINLVK